MKKPNDGINQSRKKGRSVMVRINKGSGSKKSWNANPKNWNERKEKKRNIWGRER